jgi:hypothetical protein
MQPTQWWVGVVILCTLLRAFERLHGVQDMLLTIGTNVAWVLFLLVWGVLLISNSKSYEAELKATKVSDDVTDSNI